MGKLERFERQERIKQMEKVEAQRRVANQQERAQQIAENKVRWNSQVDRIKARYAWCKANPSKIRVAALVMVPIVLLGSIAITVNIQHRQELARIEIQRQAEIEKQFQIEAEAQRKKEVEQANRESEAKAQAAANSKAEREAELAARTPNEVFQQHIASNTPGLLASETMGLIDADVLAEEIIPITCSMVQDTSVTIAESKVLIADSILRSAAAGDQKKADNLAEGLVKTALEPGVCN